MSVVDANVVLRYVLDDHAELSPRAAEILEQQTAILLMEVACEVVYVLQKVMVDVAVTNQKLRDRAVRILTDLTGLSRGEAAELLERSGRRVKLALLIHWTGVTAQEGEALLEQHQGNLLTSVASCNP